MRATTLLAGAGILGLGASAAIAAPAAADSGPVVYCDNISEHVPTTSSTTPDSYFDCVPQYGLGKVSFSIESEDGDYPDGFDLSARKHNKVTSNFSNSELSRAETYAGSMLYPAVLDLEPLGDVTSGTLDPAAAAALPPELESALEDLPSLTVDPESFSTAAGESTQSYFGLLVFRIASVERIDETAAPFACRSEGTETYTDAYRITYKPTRLNFTTTYGGQVWKHVVTAAPPELELYLNLDPTEVSSTVPFMNGYADGTPQCGVSGGTSLAGVYANDGSFGDEPADVLLAFNSFLLGPYIFDVTSIDGPDDIPSAGFFSGSMISDGSELAETGTEGTLSAIVAGGALALLGASLLLRARRRRRTAGEAAA